METWNEIGTLLGIHLADVLRTGLRFLAIWLCVWFGVRLLNLGARQIERSVDDGDATVTSHREKRGRTLAQLVRTFGRALVITLGVLLTLNLFIDIGPLLAGAGVVGLAFSFGAQSLVKDLISGFFLLLEDQLVVGDVVQINDRTGVVENMTLRVVQIRSPDGTLHIIPCGSIAMVSNMTRGFSKAVVEVGVAYAVGVDRALAVLRDEAEKFAADPTFGPRLDGPPEVLGVEALADNALTIRTILRTLPGLQFDVGREFRRRAKNRLDAEGIEIPFPQRTVWLRIEDAKAVSALASKGQPGAS